MDIGVIVALVVAITLTLIAGVLAGLFGGMWWQARKTAEVWEKAYTHVRELVSVIRHDTYNTGRETTPAPRDPVREPRRDGGPVPPTSWQVRPLVGEQPPEQGILKERVVVHADTRAPVTPSPEASRFADVELEDDPFAPQVKR